MIFFLFILYEHLPLSLHTVLCFMLWQPGHGNIRIIKGRITKTFDGNEFPFLCLNYKLFKRPIGLSTISAIFFRTKKLCLFFLWFVINNFPNLLLLQSTGKEKMLACVLVSYEEYIPRVSVQISNIHLGTLMLWHYLSKHIFIDLMLRHFQLYLVDINTLLR